MKSKFFIRYQPLSGTSWPNAITDINIYRYDANLLSYAQRVQLYHRSDYKMQIFKTLSNDPETFLSIGHNTYLTDQTVTINKIDTNLIMSKLDTGNYNSLFFALYYNEETKTIGDLEIIGKSDYYARNKKTGFFENLTTGETITESNPKFNCWYNVTSVVGANIYYMTVNPIMVTIVTDIDGEFNDVDYRVLYDDDGSFAQSIFNPKISRGTLVNNNTIFTENDSLVIDVLGNSLIHNTEQIPKKELPKIKLDVESNLDIKVNNNLVNVNIPNNGIYYVKIKFITDSSLDFPTRIESESTEKSFIIIRQ